MAEDLIEPDMIPILLDDAISKCEQYGVGGSTSGSSSSVPASLQAMIKELAQLCDVALPSSSSSGASLSASPSSYAASPASSMGNLMNSESQFDASGETPTSNRQTPTPKAVSLSASAAASGNLTASQNASQSASGSIEGEGSGITAASEPGSPNSESGGGGGGGDTKKVIPMRACVVCGEIRAGEQRKSGFKCYLHIGVPSSATFVQRVEELDFLDVTKFTLDTKPLGKGAFGRVHRATHRDSGQKFAVKILDRNQLERLKMLNKIESEINILKALSHPNIVKIYAVAESRVAKEDEDPKLFIMMEFLEGGQVCHIDDEGRSVESIPPVRVKKWLLGMSVGLQYMHEKGFVHRDIKPENILVDRKKDCVKLTDFGVSSDMSGEMSNADLNVVEGSPAFMPPELFMDASATRAYGLDQMTLGKAQDVWALGVTSFVMAFGYLPFYGKSRLELTEQVLNKPLPFPEDAEPNVVDLCKRMMERDINKRITIPEVLQHPFFKGVRVVKGIPVEADPITIAVREFPADRKLGDKIEEDMGDEFSAGEDAVVYLPPGVAMAETLITSAPHRNSMGKSVIVSDSHQAAEYAESHENSNVATPQQEVSSSSFNTASASEDAHNKSGGTEDNNNNNNTGNNNSTNASSAASSASGSSNNMKKKEKVPWTKAQAALGQFVQEAIAEGKHLELVVGSTYSVTLCKSES